MTTEKLNKELTITYYNKKACLYHPAYGYLGFIDDNAIYTPVGGENALKDILNAGGFTTFKGMFFVNFETNTRYLFQ